MVHKFTLVPKVHWRVMHLQCNEALTVGDSVIIESLLHENNIIKYTMTISLNLKYIIKNV